MSHLDQQFNLRDLIADLPPAVKQAISNMDVVSEIYDIGKQFGLLISETGFLFEETGKAVAGKTRPEDFVAGIRSVLGDENKPKATDVAMAINTKILIPIRDDFKRISMGSPTKTLGQSLGGQATSSPITSSAMSTSSPATATFVQSLQNQSSTAPKPPSFATSTTSPAPSKTQTIPQTALQSAISNNKLSGEMESATPHGAETSTNNKNTNVPLNLPTNQVFSEQQLKAEAETKREVPMWRTMQKDVSANSNSATTADTSAQSSNRGKFGSGIAPSSAKIFKADLSGTQNPDSTSGQNNSSISPNLGGQVKVKPNVLQPSNPIIVPTPPAKTEIPRPPSPTQGPAPSEQPPAFVPPSVKPITSPTEKISSNGSGNDIIGDKLTKIVRVPSERKQYVVDPYREPTE